MEYNLKILLKWYILSLNIAAQLSKGWAEINIKWGYKWRDDAKFGIKYRQGIK